MLAATRANCRGTAGPVKCTPDRRAAITLADCTLAVIGLGGIGAETARRGLAFGMRVLGVDPRRASTGRRDVVPPGVRARCWAERFRRDRRPHTPETFKLFNRERIGWMKRSAYLINIGRGDRRPGRPDRALQAGVIAGRGWTSSRSSRCLASIRSGRWKT